MKQCIIGSKFPRLTTRQVGIYLGTPTHLVGSLVIIRGLGEHNTQIKSEIELSIFGPNCLVVSSGKVLVLSRIKMSGTNGPNKI